MTSATDVYRRTRKPADLPFNTWVARPLAAPIVAWLEPTRVTPNQVTLTALVVAVSAAAVLVAVPGHAGLVAGGVVFTFSYVLDCADGMLARLRGVASTVGHLLDFLMDEIKAFVLLAAVAVRLWLERGDERWLLAGLAGLVCLASGIAITTFQRRPEVAGAGRTTPAPSGGAPSPLRRAVGLVEGAARLVIHYPSYFLGVALTGRVELYFVPYVTVNAIYAARALAAVALAHGR
ncbi:MAG: CDP-alcohol phosphatidyltransferase family protein [Polyangiaceae bacterium]|nr:CDP-alcohol phosphatidyltransferase family protein [Polyangiaceae bacterium]